MAAAVVDVAAAVADADAERPRLDICPETLTEPTPMNTRPFFRLAALSFCVGALGACGGGDTATETAGTGGPEPLVDASGVSSFDSTPLATSLSALPTQDLSETETASLRFMREEEKLAGDVYARLHTQWGTQTRVLGNIAISEDNHTEFVRQLLLRYALSDPAAGMAEGQFENPELQALYTQLTTAGAASLDAALLVGMTIEDLDIRDIRVALEAVDNDDIRLVYEELLKGSRNHLRAFYKVLLQRGGSYTPQYITPAEFEAIVNSPTERG